MRFIFLLLLVVTSNVGAFTLTAKSWLVADENNMILDGRDLQTVRSMASITKVMTVIAVLEAEQDLNQPIKYHNVKLTRRELMEISLVKSDNHASDLLCKHYPNGYRNCIEDMNILARRFEMNNTTYTDATGLLSTNTTTAVDLLKLLNVAERYPLIVEASKKNRVEILIRKKWFIFNNTNPLIGKKHEFIVSKTGTTSAAGGCIILTVKTDKGLRRVVVLGSRDGRTRIPEADFLVSSQ